MILSILPKVGTRYQVSLNKRVVVVTGHHPTTARIKLEYQDTGEQFLVKGEEWISLMYLKLAKPVVDASR